MAQKLTAGTFIAKARQIYGEKYDYSKVEYINATTKILITCPLHGDYEQTPAHHLHDHLECKECVIEAKETHASIFLAKAQIVHGDKYDYRLVKYSDNRTPITILCSQHGPFRLLPNSHLGGKGCRHCSAARDVSGKIE